MPAPRDQALPRLDRLLAGLAEVAACPPLAVAGLTLDSRAVEPGWLFLALAGARRHGMAFAGQAARRGAAAILAEPAADWPAARLHAAAAELGIPVLPLAGLAARASTLAARFFGEPGARLRIVGVTGTNGKTSVSQLLAQALSHDGRCGVLGTLGYGFPGSLAPASHTTPDPVSLQRWLAELRDAGAAAVAMEVSSHALHQQRVAAVPFDTAVFTNLTRDHLDYHGTLEAYGETKAELFRRPGLRRAVINADDPFGRRLLGELHGGPLTLACGERAAADAADRWLTVGAVDARRDGLRVRYASSWGEGVIEAPLLGRFNAENLALVLGVLLAWGVAPAEAAARLARLAPVPGRMEAIEGGADQPLAVVDYAHTPDALAKVLASLRDHVAGDLICVFGCGGERDRGKRPLMGEVAERLADRVVLTDDNPRGEDGAAIVAEILAGCRAPNRITVLRNRAQAIRSALRGAGGRDLVLIAGKGHEDYQLVGELRLPFSDAAEVRAALLEARA
ncbi:MAG: UDP-N-acetylmuramoyl-L-alanyl-D-glutamate--2,6-diaminopimelate ligase [Gammaproteobacteria bacterium]